MNSSQIGLFDGTGNTGGNKTLVEYGIQNEGSHYRAHVCYQIQRVYVFPTEEGKRLVASGQYAPRDVFTGQIKTAVGYPVPISHIGKLQEIIVPPDMLKRYRIESHFATGLRGRLATEIVAAMIRRGLVPLPIAVDVTDEKALQIDGTDIIVSANLHIQVKLDHRGGDRRYGGTGNLFFQTWECNPGKQY